MQERSKLVLEKISKLGSQINNRVISFASINDEKNLKGSQSHLLTEISFEDIEIVEK